MRVCAAKGTIVAAASAKHGGGGRTCFARERDDRPAFRVHRPGSRRDAAAASDKGSLGDAGDGQEAVAMRLPKVMVPVLSSRERVDVAGGLHRSGPTWR